MNHQLLQYITFARGRKVKDKDIRDNLVAAGWEASQVDEALKADDSTLLMPPPPPGAAVTHSGISGGSSAPIAVIQQRTTRGLEYIIMFLALGVTAVALGALLHSVVDNGFGYSSDLSGFTSYAASALIVALPIFAILFLRLKKAELANPQLRADPSRRHAIQLLLVVAFLWGLFRLVTYIYSLINGSGAEQYLGSNITAPLGNFLHTLVTVGIAGSIFAYYWADEHREKQ
jgi:hypothetical protein